MAGGKFAMIANGQGLDLLDAHKLFPDPPLSDHMPGGYVVSDAVYPGPQRTTPVEMRETAPQVKMNVLEQIAACFRIGLIRTRQPVQSSGISVSRLLVQFVLFHSVTFDGPGSSSKVVVIKLVF